MEPVTAALNIATNIGKRASQARTNRQDCLQLAALAERTVEVLKQVQGRVECDGDGALLKSLEVLNDALEASHTAVKECCEVSVFVAFWQAGRFNDQLRQAATLLAHALDQLPLATVGITTDIHDCVSSLRYELNQALFQQTAQEAKRTSKLKEEMNMLYNDNQRSNEELKKMIKSVIDEASLTAEQHQEDLSVFKKFLIQANKNKEKQEAYEIEQIIQAMESSKEELAKSSAESTLDQIEAIVKCPISHEPMMDPVLLKDSCITYDRSSITEWLRRCNRRDPVTNEEMVSGKLFPNLVIKNIVEVFTGTEGVTKDSEPGASASQQQLVPGLYEGYGNYESDQTTYHQFTALVLEPDGNIVGCTLVGFSTGQPYERFIFRGKWQADSSEMQWTDEYYVNDCKVVIDPAYSGTKFSLKGTSTPHIESIHPKTVQYKTFHFEYPQMTIAPLMYHRMPLPGLLEMEGLLKSKQQQFKQKLVLSVHEDSTFTGWLRLEDLSSNVVTFGRICSGLLQDIDNINFSIEFTESTRESEEDSVVVGTLKFTGSLDQRGGISTLQTSEMIGFARYVKSSNASSNSDLSLHKFSEFTFHTIRQTSREIPKHLRCLIKPMRPPSEPERDVKLGLFKIWTANEVKIEGVTQRFCLEVSRCNWMDPYDQNMVQCHWHNSHNIYPLWTVEKARGVGNYYIKTHETFWSGRRNWWVPDSSYLTIEESSKFKKRRSKGYYLVVHPDKDKACVWNLTYTSDGIKIEVANVGNNSALSEVIGCFLCIPRIQDKRGGEIVYHAMLTTDDKEGMKIMFDYHGVIN